MNLHKSSPNFSEGLSSSVSKQKFSDAEKFTVPGPGLGPVNRATLVRDPKHLGFTLARYKFVAKMFAGKSSVFEVGCHEGTGSLVVASEVGELTAMDFQEQTIAWCKDEYTQFYQNISWVAADAMCGIPPSKSGSTQYDAGYLLDVLEHIDPGQEVDFLNAIVNSLNSRGSLIVGIPSLESQPYASPVSKVQHINCKTLDDLRSLMLNFFDNVFMFGMNDEVLHVGFSRMCHYIFALGVGPKLRS